MKRYITAAVGVAILIPLCFLSHTILWPIVLNLFCLLAVHEMLFCIRLAGDKAFSVVSYVFALLPTISWLLDDAGVAFYKVIFAALIFYLFAEQTVSVAKKNVIPTTKLYEGIGTVLYVVVSFTAVVLLRRIDQGVYIFFMVFAGAWLSDTGAFFMGKAFGKHRLCPEISPKKTVEGAIGGIVFDMIGFLIYALVLRFICQIEANVVGFVFLGALISVFGQLGDLFASCIKRHYGIKDYGKVFPGHGGVLDRFDSCLPIASFILAMYALIGSSVLIS